MLLLTINAPPSDILFLLTILTLFGYLSAVTAYNLYYHPLSRFPGPALWAATRLPYMVSMQRGTLVHRMRDFHAKYGDMVRVGPNELSCTDPAAWRDIYGHRDGLRGFAKNPVWMSRPTSVAHSILSADDENHHRIRKLLSHAFSEKALREQEPMLQSYADILIRRLHQQVDAGWANATVDLVQWFNWTTFDIIGDLGFSETFHCLTDAQHHSWVAMVFSHFKAASFLTSIKFIPFLEHIVRLWTPQLLRRRQLHYSLSKDKIHRRLSQKSSKHDLMSYVIANNDVDGMDPAEIEATFNIMIIAGSETTASALSAITKYLLQNSDVYQRLVKEIRGSFENEKDITLSKVTTLTYLSAVLEEGLRLAPPVPGGLPRIVPDGGALVCGEWIPAETHISFNQWAAYTSPSKFKDAESFVPERWLDSSEGASYTKDVRSVFQPFSYGPRDCIGRRLAYAEMRLILARLMWNFDLSLPDGTRSASDWSKQKTYVLWEKKPLMVKLEKTGSSQSGPEAGRPTMVVGTTELADREPRSTNQ